MTSCPPLGATQGFSTFIGAKQTLGKHIVDELYFCLHFKVKVYNN